MGAYRGEPAELVRCETVDLEVPATAEIVLEGFISDDPATWELEGPFGEFTGYVSDVPTPRPTMKVTCITHRSDPIFRGCLEGTLPGSYSENSVMSSVQRAGDRVEHPERGRASPASARCTSTRSPTASTSSSRSRKHYQGQPKQIAAALWGIERRAVPLQERDRRRGGHRSVPPTSRSTGRSRTA